jgi:hypothetical protein
VRQRGRKSIEANLIPLNVSGGQSFLKAPATLSSAERQLFAEVVGAVDPRHFVKSDMPLLVSYIQATIVARRLTPKGARPDPKVVTSWERAVRVQATLATRLRLAPQSRTSPKTVGRYHDGTRATEVQSSNFYDELRAKNGG